MSDADDRDLDESIDIFESALSAPRIELTEPKLTRLLLALDKSNQDPTAEALAAAIAKRRSLPVHIVYAYEGKADEARERYLAERVDALRARGLEVTVSREADEQSYDQILTAQASHDCGLIVLPAPYLDDLRTLGAASIGTTLDMLMARSEVPLLVVREPQEQPERCLEDILLPVTVHTEENALAASWALHLIADEGTVRMLAIVDSTALEATRHLLGKYMDAHALDPDVLEELETKENAGLNAALQKAASERDLGCKVKVRVGNPVEIVSEVGDKQPQLIVSGCPSDRSSVAYQRVQGFIRHLANPVLLV